MPQQGKQAITSPHRTDARCRLIWPTEHRLRCNTSVQLSITTCSQIPPHIPAIESWLSIVVSTLGLAVAKTMCIHEQGGGARTPGSAATERLVVGVVSLRDQSGDRHDDRARSAPS